MISKFNWSISQWSQPLSLYTVRAAVVGNKPFAVARKNSNNLLRWVAEGTARSNLAKNSRRGTQKSQGPPGGKAHAAVGRAPVVEAAAGQEERVVRSLVAALGPGTVFGRAEWVGNQART